MLHSAARTNRAIGLTEMGSVRVDIVQVGATVAGTLHRGDGIGETGRTGQEECYQPSGLTSLSGALGDDGVLGNWGVGRQCGRTIPPCRERCAQTSSRPRGERGELIARKPGAYLQTPQPHLLDQQHVGDGKTMAETAARCWESGGFGFGANCICPVHCGCRTSCMDLAFLGCYLSGWAGGTGQSRLGGTIDVNPLHAGSPNFEHLAVSFGSSPPPLFGSASSCHSFR